MNKPKMQAGNALPGLVWKLIVVNTLSCAVEVCLAVGTVYMPPLLLQAGMEERYMTTVFAVSPVLSLIFIPMIGSASDLWRGSFGRRPFIWMLSLGVILSLQVLSWARCLAELIYPAAPWLEAVLRAGGFCLMEFCGQACITLLAALLSDLFPREEENHRAFSVNSLMISLGGCLGFLLPAVDWSQSPIAIYMGGQEPFIYTLLTVLFLSCLLTTVFIPEKTGIRGGERSSVTYSLLKLSRYKFHSFLHWPQCFFVTLRRCASACASLSPRVHAVFMRIPMVIWTLCVADMCSWMALLSIMFFFANFLGEGFYHGVPSAELQSQERKHFDEGVRVASLGLFLQCIVSVLCSMLMTRWVALLGAKVVYISSVVLLVFATAIMSVSDSVIVVTVMVAVTGYTLSVLQILPQTLLCLYHSDKQAFFTSFKPRPLRLSCYTGGLTSHRAEPSSGSLHVSLLVGGGEANSQPVLQRGMCFDMAILDSAYLLSQVLPALCLGSIVQLANSVRAYMACACCFSLLAFLCSTRVVYSHADLHQQHQQRI